MEKITKGINVLMLGSDMGILQSESDVRQRMEEYGKLVNRLDIVIYNGNFRGGSEDDIYKISSNTFAYPRSFLGLLGLFKVNPRKLSFILNHKIDLVTTQDPFILGMIGRRLARWLWAGFQVQIHTDFMSPYYARESFYNRTKVWIAKSVLKSATGVRVVSQRIKNSIKKLNLKVDPFVLPIWIDVNSIKHSDIKINLKYKYPQFKKIFLMASRITVEKNIFLAIRAFESVVKNNPSAGLIIVGDGPFKNKLMSIVRQKGLQKNIIFEGWSEDLASYYKTCDVFLNTSNYEGYGRTIIEALSAGTPVVTTDVGSAGEFIKDRENGFIFRVGSNKRLKNIIYNILFDEKVLAKIKEGAKNTRLELGSRGEYLKIHAKSWSDSIIK